MPWDEGIEGNALEIARTDDSPLRIMAGPGTGKSFTMNRRVARVLEEEDVDPERILAVTFTRTAARDLKDELHQLGIEGCENIHAGTLHSFCFRLLGKNHVLEYLNRHPQPLLTVGRSVLKFQAAPLLKDLQWLGDFGGLREMTERIRAYVAAWARLQRDEPGWVEDEVDRNFERELVDWLRFHKGMLIGELVPYALRYLRDNPQAEERGYYEYVIVDEYQDLNKAEQVLIDLISEDSNRSIVGDVDQSIYSFRFAHPEGIVEYAETHEGTTDANLEECRRCPSSVVQVADSLIKQNHPDLDGARLLILIIQKDKYI
jgi:superfamily I DNA/RNA helicase